MPELGHRCSLRVFEWIKLDYSEIKCGRSSATFHDTGIEWLCLERILNLFPFEVMGIYTGLGLKRALKVGFRGGRPTEEHVAHAFFLIAHIVIGKVRDARDLVISTVRLWRIVLRERGALGGGPGALARNTIWNMFEEEEASSYIDKEPYFKNDSRRCFLDVLLHSFMNVLNVQQQRLQH